ncbi:hypothetical protein Dimus_039203 [Dionaea muscipula]
MFHFERGMDPELVVHVRACRCTTLDEMVEQATQLEDALIAVKGSGQKRSREASAQSVPQPETSQKKPQLSASGGSGGSTYKQWFCKKCQKHHSRGRSCDGRPLTCHNCGRPGHIAATCRISGSRQNQGGESQVTVEEATVQKPSRSASQASSGSKSVTVGSDRPLIPGRVYTLTQVETETAPAEDQE